MDLILGTSLWGWTVSENTCFEILDEFYDNNFREIDTATNYPINKDSRFFRFAETIIKNWIRLNGINDLIITIKVGSIDNSGSADNNLSYSFLIMSQDYYLETFTSNLGTFMIHWDNRNDEEDISQTICALNIINMKNKVGLSGIKEPEIYHKYLKDNNITIPVQIKHNIFTSQYNRYKIFHGLGRFVAYGINAGGLKLTNEYTSTNSAIVRGISTSQYQKYLPYLRELISNSADCKSLNDLSMIYAFNSPYIEGMISGASSRNQIKETIRSFNSYSQFDTSKLYHDLLKFQQNLVL